MYIPIGSMFAIYGNIYHQYTPNVSIYIYHTWILWDNKYILVNPVTSIQIFCYLLGKTAYVSHAVLQAVAEVPGSWHHPLSPKIVNWRFPKMKVPPSHHPFIDGFSMKETIQLWGYLNL